MPLLQSYKIQSKQIKTLLSVLQLVFVIKRYYPGGKEVFGHARNVLDAASQGCYSSLISQATLNAWKLKYNKILTNHKYNIEQGLYKPISRILFVNPQGIISHHIVPQPSSSSPLMDKPLLQEDLHLDNTLHKSIDNPLSSAIKSKYPVLVYNSPKEIQGNHLCQQYMSQYEEKGLLIPFAKTIFPQNGVSGSYTLPPAARTELIKNNAEYLDHYSYLKTRYAVTMYGGEPIVTLNDILHRAQQLFTYDETFSLDALYKKNVFPVFQHELAFDTYGLVVPTKNVEFPSNYNVSMKKITLQNYSEVLCIQHSHDFLINDELVFIDLNNPKHLELLNQNNSNFQTIAHQPNIDMIGFHQVLGTNQRVFYPIDAKTIAYPERSLPMLSSCSSRSPNYECLCAAEKLYGEFHVKLSKLSKVSKGFFTDDLERLMVLIKARKKNTYTEQEFQKHYKNYVIDLFQKQVKTGQIVHENMSFLPSSIGCTQYPFNNSYQTMQKNNPEKFNIMKTDATGHFNYDENFPKLEDSRKLKLYDRELLFMEYLKKHDMINNYYAVRTLLEINDIA